jgi:hypothetical protein
MIMTLQAGERLMSLTEVSEMLGIPVTRCTAGGTRATAQSATGLVVTCATAGRPSRLGWSNKFDKR